MVVEIGVQLGGSVEMWREYFGPATRIYGIDINHRNDFDIIINTEKLTAEQVSSLIVAAARWASQNRLDRRNLHLLRIRKIISDNLDIDPKILVDDSLSIDVKEIYQRLEGDDLLSPH